MGRICKVNVPIKSRIYMHHLSDCVCRRTMTWVVSYAVYSAVFFMQQRGHNGFFGAFIVPSSVTCLTQLTATWCQCVRFPEEKNAPSKAWKSGQVGHRCSTWAGVPSTSDKVVCSGWCSGPPHPETELCGYCLHLFWVLGFIFPRSFSCLKGCF